MRLFGSWTGTLTRFAGGSCRSPSPTSYSTGCPCAPPAASSADDPEEVLAHGGALPGQSQLSRQRVASVPCQATSARLNRAQASEQKISSAMTRVRTARGQTPVIFPASIHLLCMGKMDPQGVWAAMTR